MLNMQAFVVHLVMFLCSPGSAEFFEGVEFVRLHEQGPYFRTQFTSNG